MFCRLIHVSPVFESHFTPSLGVFGKSGHGGDKPHDRGDDFLFIIGLLPGSLGNSLQFVWNVGQELSDIGISFPFEIY